MFTTIGNMANACIGDPRSIYFPGQKVTETADVIVGVIALVAGAIIFSQGYQVSGTLLIAFSVFQSNIVFGNIMAFIKIKRLEKNDAEKNCCTTIL